MYNIYVPYNDINSFDLYYYNNDLTLIYATNDNINYDIIDLKNHYNIINSDNVNLDNSILIDKSLITNNWTYRNDLSDLLICLFFFVIFFFGTPLFLFSRLFKKKF